MQNIKYQYQLFYVNEIMKQKALNVKMKNVLTEA